MRDSRGFTIVELLIVIVVIAILAAISIMAYNGIQDRARETGVKSELTLAAKQLELDRSTSGRYPATKEAIADGNGLGNSNGTTAFQYTVSADGSTYCLSGVADDKAFYLSSTNKSAVSGVCEGHTAPSADGETPADPPTTYDGITIGNQMWAKTNLNVGTMITGTATPSDNGVIEKYCYGNSEANCATYGALYTWGEAMQYSSTAGAQGICPAGSHIPSDNEWKALEISLGMTQAQADTTGWRGTDQGTQLKSGGSSGLDIPLGGYRSSADSYGYRGTGASVWTSSPSGGSVWRRYLHSDYATVYRGTYAHTFGFSVRCLEN